MKRLFDLCLSGLGLVLSAPVWLLVALAIRLEDGGPVFFTQPRVGRGGRPFTAYKFRSMFVAASVEPARQVVANDQRITRVGRLLRAMALDELPQLWNIFIGDMSFVGPRPLAVGEIEARGDGRFVRLEEIPGYVARHAVRPGLTGLAQVYARRDLPRPQKFRFDALYCRRAGFWLDVRLIALSFWISARGRWEHPGPKV